MVAVAQPLVLNAVTGISGHYLADKDRPAGIALGTASTFAGLVIAFVLGAVLPDAGDLRTLVAIGAVVAAAGALVLAVTLRRPGQQPRPAATTGREALRVSASDPFVRRLCALVFFPFGTFIALSTFGQALLEPAGVRSEVASVILLLSVVAGVVGCAVVPVLAVRRRAEVRVMRTGLVGAGLACLVLTVAPGVGTGFVAFVVLGAALLPALPIVLELVERRTGEAEGTAAGLVWLSGNLGGLVVSLLVGLAVGAPALGFALCAAAALAGVPLVGSLRRYLPEPGRGRPGS